MRFTPHLDGSHDPQNDSGSEFDPSSANSGNNQGTARIRSRRSRRNLRARDEPRDVPCAACVKRMAQVGPDALCRSQDSPSTVACYGCAKVGRKCCQVPEMVLPHVCILQEAAGRIIDGEPILNWDTLALQAKEAVLRAGQNPHSIPDPPMAINQGAAPSPEPPQSPPTVPEPPQSPPTVPEPSRSPLSVPAPPTGSIAAAVARNNELVAKTNQLLRRVLGEIGALNRGVEPEPGEGWL
ncbi:hypothetical protein ACHAPT_005885 [Fusarium lateritium]